MTDIQDRGGVPFEDATEETQRAILAVLEQIASINFCINEGCAWLLLKMQLTILHGQIGTVLTVPAPNNLAILPGLMRLNDGLAESIASEVEIPDTLPDFWPEEDV